jgi:tRNA modification GTPase
VQALAQVDAHLEQAAAQLLIPSPALDLLAEELRLAQNAFKRSPESSPPTICWA